MFCVCILYGTVRQLVGERLKGIEWALLMIISGSLSASVSEIKVLSFHSFEVERVESSVMPTISKSLVSVPFHS